MDRKRLIVLANECGIGDKDLGNADSVVTDYGDSTASVLRFAEIVASALMTTHNALAQGRGD